MESVLTCTMYSLILMVLVDCAAVSKDGCGAPACHIVSLSLGYNVSGIQGARAHLRSMLNSSVSVKGFLEIHKNMSIVASFPSVFSISRMQIPFYFMCATCNLYFLMP